MLLIIVFLLYLTVSDFPSSGRAGCCYHAIFMIPNLASVMK